MVILETRVLYNICQTYHYIISPSRQQSVRRLWINGFCDRNNPVGHVSPSPVYVSIWHCQAAELTTPWKYTSNNQEVC